MNGNPKGFLLINSDVFEYDFSSCAYNILKNSGYDVSTIEKDDKTKRNIQIGYIQRDNPDIARYIQNSIENLVDFYLKENNIKKEDVILRQKDGIFTKKKMTNIDCTMPIDFRGIVLKLIFDVTRKKWLLVYGKNNVVVKGITNRPCDTSFYNMFSSIDFSNKDRCIRQLEYIRRSIYNSKNIRWFSREIEDNQLLIPVKGIGEMKVRQSVLQMIDPEDIEKSFLWEDYVWPFCRSIMIYIER